MLGYQPEHRREKPKAAPAKGAARGYHPEHYRGLQQAAPVKGAVPGQGRADSVPAMLAPEEYVLPADTVSAVGKENLDALLAQTHTPTPVEAHVPRGFNPKVFLANGGSVEEAGRKLAPYVDHRAPNGPPAMPAQPQLGNSVQPQTGLQKTNRPNFTMGGNDAAAPARPAGPDVSDVRAKYNPANGSPEAKAWQAERAAGPAAPAAPATAAAPVPASAPAAAPQGAGYRAGAAIGRAAAPVLRAAGAAAFPAALAGTASAAFETPTSAYEKRFGFEPNTTEGLGGFARDVGVRALGVASDLGDTLTMGLAGRNLYADKQPGAATPSPGVTPTPAPAAGAGAGRGSVNPATANPNAPVPTSSPSTAASAAGPSSDVTRVDNSYSGSNIVGDITINGKPPRNGGQISDQNMAAADALAARNGGATPAAGYLPEHLRNAGAGVPATSRPGLGYQPGNNRGTAQGLQLGYTGTIGQVGNGNMWSRTPEQQRRDAQTQASSIHRPTAARGYAALQNLNVQDALATREAGETQRAQLRDSGETGRAQMREDGASQRVAGELGLGYSRLGADRARLDIDRTRAAGDERARGYSLRAADRLDQLQQQYSSTKDEGQRSQLARRIREIQGNAQSADWGVQVTPAVKNADGSTSEGSVIRFNKATGDVSKVDGGAKPAAGPIEGAIYTDASGNRARWTGSAFDPI